MANETSYIGYGLWQITNTLTAIALDPDRAEMPPMPRGVCVRTLTQIIEECAHTLALCGAVDHVPGYLSDMLGSALLLVALAWDQIHLLDAAADLDTLE